ncbi:unnamed protein product [Malus baccata var. baccata]
MSSSETQRTAKPSLSLTFKSEKPHLNPKLRVAEIDSLSSKTPEKPQQFRHKSLWEPTQKQPAAQIGSVRRKIDSWSEENLIETHFGASEKLPEKYEILSEFFDCLDASIRLLRLRGLMPSFTNLRPKIECLTDRRFTISHLAQLKVVLPEVIEITKVLVKDERTSDMKPDLRVTMNVDAVENDNKLKSEGGGHMHLRRAFRHRLGDISKSHPEGYEIPEETLPPPLNFAEQHMHPDTIKCSLSSSPEALTGAHTVEQPEASKTYLQSDGIPDETHPIPSDQSKEDLNSNISGIPDPSLPNETSFEAPVEQLPVITTHLPQSFRRHFSLPAFQGRNVLVPESNFNIVCSIEEASVVASSFEAQVEQQPVITSHLPQPFRRHFSQPSFQARNISLPESNLNVVCSVEGASTAVSLTGQVPATPTKETSPIESGDDLPTKCASILSTPKLASTPVKEIGPIENDDDFPIEGASIQSTPAKLASTPARLMSATPALRPPKRCYMSPDDYSTSSPEKMVRYPPRSRSLKFDTPVKNKMVEDEVLYMDNASIDNDFTDIPPEDLLKLLKDEERTAIEEQIPAISQAKRDKQMISSLPKLFDMIHFLFQSMNRSAITKEELVHKLIWNNLDFTDTNEVEEQLTLLLDLVPEWISEETLESGGDLLMIHINKMSNPDSIRAQLEAAN